MLRRLSSAVRAMQDAAHARLLGCPLLHTPRHDDDRCVHTRHGYTRHAHGHLHCHDTGRASTSGPPSAPSSTRVSVWNVWDASPLPWLGLAFLGVRLPCRAPRRYALRLKCSARPALRSARGASTELRPTSSPTARALKPLCTVHACVHAFSRTRPRRPFLVTGPSSRQTTGGR